MYSRLEGYHKSLIMVRRNLAECLAENFGFEHVEVPKKDDKSRFLLVENRILDQPCARLLLTNVGFLIAPGA